MLLEHIPQLAHQRIVLASASPRRKELLSRLGLKFEVITSSFDETLPKDQFTAAEYARQTASHKALDVAAGLQHTADLVVGADTVVEIDEQVLEKPADAADAWRMLSLLSGRRHLVHTGVALVLPPAVRGGEPRVHSFAATTLVEFSPLTEAAIEAYIASGEPFGKAGSYGIQGLAGAFVHKVEGCYFNVVGFPLNAFCTELSGIIERGEVVGERLG